MLEHTPEIQLLLGLLAGIGGIICLCASVYVTCWSICRARCALLRLDAIWRHESAVKEAVAEWKARNPARLAELDRLRDSIGE